MLYYIGVFGVLGYLYSTHPHETGQDWRTHLLHPRVGALFAYITKEAVAMLDYIKD